ERPRARLKEFFNLRGGPRLPQSELPDSGAEQGMEVGAGSQCAAEIARDAADVDALSAIDGEQQVGIVVGQNADRVDGDGAGWNLDLFAAAGTVVECLATDFDGGMSRRDLADGSDQWREGLLDGHEGGCGHVCWRGGDESAFGVGAVRFGAKDDVGDVLLFAVLDAVDQPGRGARGDDAAAGRGRVQGAGVADAAHT